MNIMKKLLVTIQLVVFGLLSSTVFAGDGVLEINQTCATQLGCFSGDAAGYPITIDGSAGSSYRLSSDLIVPDENTDGIEVTAVRISIDLNGFEIVRSGCEGAEADCTPATGSGSGVVSNSQTVSVKNGRITGMGANGIDLYGPDSVVKELGVRWNRLDGITVGSSALISGNTATKNGDDGIQCGAASIVNGNVATLNGKNGINAPNGSVLIYENTVTSNSENGISSNGGSSVLNNFAAGNTNYGLMFAGVVSYRGNMIMAAANAGGTVSGGFNMGGNFCNTNDTCP